LIRLDAMYLRKYGMTLSSNSAITFPLKWSMYRREKNPQSNLKKTWKQLMCDLYIWVTIWILKKRLPKTTKHTLSYVVDGQE
jgi:hypothetical protein